MESNRPAVLFGIIVFIVIVFVWYFHRLSNLPPDIGKMIIFERHPNTSTFLQRNEPKQSNANIFYYGEYPTVSACEEKCKRDPMCRAYTWNDDAQIRYALQCYGRDDSYQLTPESGHISGVKKIINKSTG